MSDYIAYKKDSITGEFKKYKAYIKDNNNWKPVRITKPPFTPSFTPPLIIGKVVPEGGIYEQGDTVYTAGQIMPTPIPDDLFKYGDYAYELGNFGGGVFHWSVRVLSKKKTSYGQIATIINEKVVTHVYYTFENCTSLINAPVIPSTVHYLNSAFKGCTSLTVPPVIPNSVETIDGIFSGCISLTTAPIIPEGVIQMYHAFENCTSLINAPVIPNTMINMGNAFRGCTSLTTAPIIPNNVKDMFSTFYDCTSLKGTLVCNTDPYSCSFCLKNTQITNIEGSCSEETKTKLLDSRY